MQCLMATQNSTEMLLLLGRMDEAASKGQSALDLMSSSDKNIPIMMLLIWLSGSGAITAAQICEAISALQSETNFTWGFDEIAPLIASLTPSRRTVAQAFIAYFQGAMSFNELKSLCCLQNPEPAA